MQVELTTIQVHTMATALAIWSEQLSQTEQDIYLRQRLKEAVQALQAANEKQSPKQRPTTPPPWGLDSAVAGETY